MWSNNKTRESTSPRTSLQQLLVLFRNGITGSDLSTLPQVARDLNSKHTWSECRNGQVHYPYLAKRTGPSDLSHISILKCSFSLAITRKYNCTRRVEETPYVCWLFGTTTHTVACKNLKHGLDFSVHCCSQQLLDKFLSSIIGCPSTVHEVSLISHRRSLPEEARLQKRKTVLLIN
jgi:hypothetical protein